MFLVCKTINDLTLALHSTSHGLEQAGVITDAGGGLITVELQRVAPGAGIAGVAVALNGVPSTAVPAFYPRLFTVSAYPQVRVTMR